MLLNLRHLDLAYPLHLRARKEETRAEKTLRDETCNHREEEREGGEEGGRERMREGGRDSKWVEA